MMLQQTDIIEALTALPDEDEFITEIRIWNKSTATDREVINAVAHVIAQGRMSKNRVGNSQYCLKTVFDDDMVIISNRVEFTDHFIVTNQGI